MPYSCRLRLLDNVLRDLLRPILGNVLPIRPHGLNLRDGGQSVSKNQSG
jgi:hypothetical protein